MIFVLILQDYSFFVYFYDKFQQSNVFLIFVVVKEVFSFYQVFSDGFVLKINFNIIVIFEQLNVYFCQLMIFKEIFYFK